MREITILDLPDQQFSAVLNGRRITMRVRHNVTIDRYTFDLALDDEFVLHCRKIVVGADLLAPFAFGVGMIFAVIMRPGSEPNRAGIQSGGVKVFHA